MEHSELLMRLLVVEDDVKTARALADGLERGGFSVATAHTGEDGFFRLNAETFDLVVIDQLIDQLNWFTGR